MRRADRPQDLDHDIATALAQIAERFGPGVVARLRQARPDLAAAVVPSGSLALDRATGIAGLPRGHVTEFIGLRSSGKTALLYATLATVQRSGGLAALVDAAGTADAEALLACGVDLDTLLLACPASATDALLLLTILASCRGFDCLGFVSIPALRDLPAGQLRTTDDSTLAAPDLGRLLARGLRVLTAALRESPTAVIVTNEPLLSDRDERVRSTGGLALAHFAALRVMVAPLATLPDPAGGLPGLRVELTIVKHKLGTAGGRAELTLWPGRGLDQAGELLHLGLVCGAVIRDWRGYCVGDHLLDHRPAAAAAALLADGALTARVQAAILAGGEGHPPASDPSAA
jgi:recombination protein RecA